MSDWQHGKRISIGAILDALLYGSIFIGASFLDPILNLLRSFGINLAPHEHASHPFEVGRYQLTAIAFSAVQLIRAAEKLANNEYQV